MQKSDDLNYDIPLGSAKHFVMVTPTSLGTLFSDKFATPQDVGAFDGYDFSVATFGNKRLDMSSLILDVTAHAAVGSRQSIRSLLNQEQNQQWHAYLTPLLHLLNDSRATHLGVTIYTAGGTLMCEIGKPGRTLLISVDADGVTISFRKRPDDFGSYESLDFDQLPGLTEFLRILFDFQRPEASAWLKTNKRYLRITNSSDAAFATTQSTMESPNTTEAFVSWRAHSLKIELEHTSL